MIRGTLLFVTLLSYGSAGAEPAAGDGPAPSAVDRSDARAEARAWFVKARTDFDEKRFERALEALRQAYALERLPLLQRYMGDCHFALGQYEAALESYRGYLRRELEAAERVRVERQIAACEDRVRAWRERELAGRKVPVALMPTGKDRENPLHLARVGAPGSPKMGRSHDRLSWLTVGKWTALGLAAGSLAMGITFNRLAAGKASDLQQAMRTACPASAPICGGNPDLDRPVVAYSLEHYELQRQMKRNNAIAVGSFVASGVTAATSAMLFWLDHRRRTRERAERGSLPGERSGARNTRPRATRVSVAPRVGQGELGLAGEVRF